MKKKWIGFTSMMLTASMLLGGCGGTSSQTSEGETGEQTFTCSLGTVAAETSVQVEAARMFADKVSEYTNGTVTINVFPAGQIGSDESMAEDLKRKLRICVPEPRFLCWIGSDVRFSLSAIHCKGL